MPRCTRPGRRCRGCLRQEPLPGWRRRAAIVNISSIGGKLAVPHLLPYSAAKFAMVGFSEGLHAELRHKGIHVTDRLPRADAHRAARTTRTFVGQRDKEAALVPVQREDAGRRRARSSTRRRRSCRPLAEGRAEITITPQAWLAARFAGLCPETTQWIAAQANRLYFPRQLIRQARQRGTRRSRSRFPERASVRLVLR